MLIPIYLYRQASDIRAVPLNQSKLRFLKKKINSNNLYNNKYKEILSELRQEIEACFKCTELKF